MIELVDLPPAQFEAWQLLLQLEALGVEWVLIGGQMVLLLAVEHGAQLPRVTLDADVLVDVRATPGGVEQVCTWLTGQGLALEGANPDGIGHRFSRKARPGPGLVSFDVLAPEGLAGRTPTITVPPFRTVSVPGSSGLLRSAALLDVRVVAMTGESSTGPVRRPSVLASLIAKAAATTINGRGNPDRDWQDAALLLSILPEPRIDPEELSAAQHRHLRRLGQLTPDDHPAWRVLDPHPRRVARAALRLLLAAAG